MQQDSASREDRSTAGSPGARASDLYDVIVVGFGAAGSVAAIQAADEGARVLLIDRFTAGGATARSGGVIYLGGGTAQQRAAGYDDDPEQMFRYLKHEVSDAVDDATLSAYCEGSMEQLSFLEGLGVPFPPGKSAPKTSYPKDDVTLYFSGNELCPPYCDDAASAPRGHRVLGRGLTGHVLFDRLRRGVASRRIEVRTHCEARRLLSDEQGRITGVAVRELPNKVWLRRIHRVLAATATIGFMLFPSLGRWARRRVLSLEEERGQEYEVHCRGGVILCAGGFAFNEQMLREHAPIFAGGMPLGTIGDDGSGIELGRSAGGQPARMERCGAWRFINPPVALTHGLLVNSHGERICNEELYGSTLGDHIGYENAGRGFLVIDQKIRSRVLRELWKFRKINFQSITALINLFLNRVKAASLEELADGCKLPPGALVKTIGEFNNRVQKELTDPLGKSPGACQRLESPPYFAIVCDLNSRLFPTPTFTLGGLLVEGSSGEVLREGGGSIRGLYAAGRNAAGISSNSYVSGLSLGDCIFSGRRAGRHAARPDNLRPSPTEHGRDYS